MRPYCVETNRFGKEERIPWPADKANVMLRRIDDQVQKEFDARDVERAKAAGFSVTGDRIVPCEWIEDENGVGGYVVNHVLSAMKHSGAEKTDETNLRWWKFCREPQDPAQVSDDLSKTIPKVAARNGSFVSVTPVKDLAEKRRRGRPRKSALVGL